VPLANCRFADQTVLEDFHALWKSPNFVVGNKKVIEKILQKIRLMFPLNCLICCNDTV
jgi:hypothetical protein